MWGPAPAITPSANKLTQSPLINQNVNSSGDTEMSGFIQAGKKKKKGKRVIDNSILGFTVQADPDRINAGEIEQIDD
jgi:PERQ amino acid-rich with GYF domain-containing protein